MIHAGSRQYGLCLSIIVAAIAGFATAESSAHQTLHGHTDSVICVAFSPDGKRLASGSADTTVRIWNAETGKQEQVFQGHTGAVWSVAFSPDGRQLASCGGRPHDADDVLVWDVSNGKVVRRLTGLSDFVTSVTFSPDGRRIAACGIAKNPDTADKPASARLQVWDAETGEPLLSMDGHDALPWRVQYSRQGDRIVSAAGGFDASAAGEIKIWDATTGEQVVAMDGVRDVHTATFDPAGRTVVSGGGDLRHRQPGELVFWDAKSGKPIMRREFAGLRVLAAAFGPDGSLLATGHGAPEGPGRVILWDQEGKQLAAIHAHPKRTLSVVFGPNGRRLATAGDDHLIKIWNVAALKTGRLDQPPQANGNDLIQSISKVTLRRNRDGTGITWFHPRACMIPGKNGPTALMNLQEISGSDYFGQVHWSTSDDLGRTWSPPKPIAAFARDPVPGHPGLKAGVCDVTPQYHAPTDTVLALGHVVFYRGPRFARGDQLARYPVYAVRRRDGTWSPRRILPWDDQRGAFIYSNNCGQRVVMPNGDIIMSFTFGPTAENRMVAGVRCSFDGETLKVVEVGEPLENRVGRGLLEPSVTRFKDRFYMTIRAEDGRGYVAMSENGVDYQDKFAWFWEDGTPLETSTTQQHWLTHSSGLFLVYTRKDKTNTNVIRWRSPLWMAQVDVERMCLLKDTERVVLPLVGDGVNEPDGVALMGNFNVTHVTPTESWVTVGEWLPRREARGDLLMARIKWKKPNELVPKGKK